MSNDRVVLVGIFLGLLIAAVFVLTVILPAVDDCWREDAAEAGHAEFYLDADHARQWRWLPAKEPEPIP